ncbi:antitoxin Xre/MbcA/ParS toxin-binding domain-containing protein [Pseudomonas fluorescens]|uniref:antitoxin Xre/MbcA/ParS toxin-binding domain-containing protein n=1 Tax=Pseudomonas fluorescens TaxID=294 RepID=UPI0012424F91|nr:antitoxin Xre/MbcA/ParS toxin-binding domain-containing protein [Pseudomonas fluorescens]
MKPDIWVSPHSPSADIEPHDSARGQMPFSSFHHLADMLRMDDETLGMCIKIPPEKLSRRAKTGLFSLRESQCIYALITAVDASCELFEGDVQAAATFLRSPARHFNSKTPLEMLITGGDSSAVIDLIGRLEHGIPT